MPFLLGSSFHVLRCGHLMHHQYNRDPVHRPDIYYPSATPQPRALVLPGHAVFGLNLAEVLAPLACCLPRAMIRGIIERVYGGEHASLQAIRLAAHRRFLDRSIGRTLKAVSSRRFG